MTKVAEGKLDITGDLTIRGVTNRKDYGVAFDSPVNPIENAVQVQWDMAISEPKPAAAK